MTTKVTSRCYRYQNVDFEPESRSLYWSDGGTTLLSYEESRILEMLCHYAGEVLASNTLFKNVALPDTSYSQHQNVLTDLISKSFRNGEKWLPIDVVGEHGYRVALPQQTIATGRRKKMPQLDRDINTLLLEEKKPVLTAWDYLPAGIVGVCTAIVATISLFYILR